MTLAQSAFGRTNRGGRNCTCFSLIRSLVRKDCFTVGSKLVRDSAQAVFRLVHALRGDLCDLTASPMRVPWAIRSCCCLLVNFPTKSTCNLCADSHVVSPNNKRSPGHLMIGFLCDSWSRYDREIACSSFDAAKWPEDSFSIETGPRTGWISLKEYPKSYRLRGGRHACSERALARENYPLRRPFCRGPLHEV